MTLDEIDQQIAKWKQLQSSMALKLVALDERSTYQGIRSGLYQGTTAVAVGQLKDTIYQLWTLSGLLDDALSKINAMRGHAPRPWEREKWIRELAEKLVTPVIAVPAQASMDLSDTLSKPTLTLGNTLTQLVNCYDQLSQFLNKIDERMAQMNTKMGALVSRAEKLGAQRFVTGINDIADQIRSDPLGVSLDSFSSMEAQLNRYASEATERQSISGALDAGERRINEFGKNALTAQRTADECQRQLGTYKPVPMCNTQDLTDWLQTLRRKLPDTDLSSLRVGVARWQETIEATIRPVTDADSFNRSMVSRLQEVQGRFSAVQAKASTTRNQSAQVDRLGSQLNAALAANPKNIADLERLLEAYERLVFA
jgi:hypothetical protein